MRESRCGLAIRPGGSRDGLALLAAGGAMLAAIHLIEADGSYNIASVNGAMPARDFVVLEWARREQGVIVPPGNPQAVAGLADLRAGKLRLMPRQEEGRQPGAAAAPARQGWHEGGGHRRRRPPP